MGSQPLACMLLDGSLFQTSPVPGCLPHQRPLHQVTSLCPMLGMQASVGSPSSSTDTDNSGLPSRKRQRSHVASETLA